MTHFCSLMQLTYPAEQKYAGLLFYLLRERGIHIYENRAFVLTTAHSEADLAHLVRAFRESLSALQSGGFLLSSGLARILRVSGLRAHPRSRTASYDDQPAPATAFKETLAEMQAADFLPGGEERPPMPGARRVAIRQDKRPGSSPIRNVPGKYLQIREGESAHD